MNAVWHVMDMLEGDLAQLLLDAGEKVSTNRLGTMCMGFVYNRAGLFAARFILGLSEAGLSGVTCYLSCWCKRNEIVLRIALFFSAAAFAGSFGGLLAAATVQLAQ